MVTDFEYYGKCCGFYGTCSRSDLGNRIWSRCVCKQDIGKSVGSYCLCVLFVHNVHIVFDEVAFQVVWSYGDQVVYGCTDHTEWCGDQVV